MAAVLQLIKDEPAAHRWLEPYRNILRTQSTAAKNMSFAVPRSGMLSDPKQDIPHQYSVGTLGKKRGPEPYIRAYTASPTMASSTSCPVGRFAASPSVLSSLRTFTPSPSLLRHSPGDNLPSLPLPKLVSPHTPQNSFYAQFKDAFGLSEPSPLPPSSGVSYFEIDIGAIDVAATTSPLGPVSSALDGSKCDSPGYTALTKALADCLVMDQQAPAANFEAASTPNLGSPFEVGSGTSLFSPLSNNSARESTSFQEVAGRALDKEATISDDDEAQFPGIKNRNTNNDIESGPEAVEISSRLTFRSNNYQFLVMNQDSPTALHQKHKQRLQDPELDTETDKGATAMMTSTSSKQLYILTESPKGNNNKAKKRKATGDAESIKQALGKVGTRVVSSTKTRRLVSGTGIEKENESLFGRE
ncbi:hypothetical protein AMATHDRAFT_48811 [Amanita thiersii Skay4041]|uniref:Uncharacterized protein n=1 Tax=Amanita thiersii Skay4041 TaxID=703135 RepID=A0A2A9NE64_9AGAR|nr:hypothetical protein AMATHDRAFT_48811 [Amanita thiersii Skay4041]